MTDDVGFKGLEKNAAEHLNRKRNTKNVNKNQLKYVDDLTLAASIDLPQKLVSHSSKPLPDLYCTRTSYVLPGVRSEVLKELLNTEEYARANLMRINYQKTKVRCQILAADE